YDEDACQAAWRLVADLRIEEREQLRREVPRAALSAAVRGRRVAELAGELVGIAKAGLVRLGRDEARLLEPLEVIIEQGRVPAEYVLDAYQRTGGDPRKLLQALQYDFSICRRSA